MILGDVIVQMFTRIVRVQAVIAPSIKLTTRLSIKRSKLNTGFGGYRAISNMAMPSEIHLKASQQPQFYIKGLTPESADKTSQLLQLNHEKHHIFFNQSGFHVSR
jgi:hypothetical protein